MRLSRLTPLLLFVLVGCSQTKTGANSPARGSVPVEGSVVGAQSSDGWNLATTDPSAGGVPALLWNGLIGVRVARTGGALDYDGKPLDFFMIDEYENGGEEKILPMPSPILVTWAFGNELFSPQNQTTHDVIKSGGTPLDPRSGRDYLQSLDMKTGLLTTQWTQEVPSAGTVTYKCETLVHPSERVIGQRWTITCSKKSSFTMRALDYGGPEDRQEPVGAVGEAGVTLTSSPKRVVTMATKLSGADPGELASAAGFRVQEGTADAGKPVVYERVLSFGPRSLKPLPTFTPANLALLKANTPKPFRFDDLLDASKKEWGERWKTDIVIDGPPEDQLAVRSFLFYLRSAVSTKAMMAVSPFGLSNSQYNGHVFWDADIWVQPALDLVDPEEAASIANYRLSRMGAAQQNFMDWVRAGRPTAVGKLGTWPATSIPPGVKYPWESSVSGKETTTASSRFEDHITGSVIWGLTQAAEFGIVKRPMVDNAAALASSFYYSRAKQTPNGLEIDGVMSPDENHTGDNDLYTNLLAQWLVDGRRWTDQKTGSLPHSVLPSDGTSFLSYDKDQLKGYKQAAAILSIYPLQYPPAEAEAKAMVERFAPKVIPNGPAMSDSLNALILARLGEQDQAYTEWRKSWQDFTNNPFLLFSEKRTKPTTYFTTGAGGCLQAVLYGFLGFRLDWKAQPGAVWSKKLLGDSVLSLKPNLPPQWKSVKFKNFTLLGVHCNLTANPGSATVTQGE